MAVRGEVKPLGEMGGLMIGYKAFATPRSDLMLDIYVNGERRYRLGPFDNKQLRQRTLDKLRSTVRQVGGGHMRVW